VTESHTEGSNVIGELESLHPEVDWAAVPSADLSPVEVADHLTAAGCDPAAVKRFVLDD
jgi:hypothetical protein